MGYNLEYGTYGFKFEPLITLDEVAANADYVRAVMFDGSVIIHGVMLEFWDTYEWTAANDLPEVSFGMRVGSIATTTYGGTSGDLTVIQDVCGAVDDDNGAYHVWIPRTANGTSFYYAYVDRGGTAAPYNYTNYAAGTYYLQKSTAGNALVPWSGAYPPRLVVKFSQPTGTNKNGVLRSVVVRVAYTLFPHTVDKLGDDEIAKYDAAAEKALFGVGIESDGTGVTGAARYV